MAWRMRDNSTVAWVNVEVEMFQVRAEWGRFSHLKQTSIPAVVLWKGKLRGHNKEDAWNLKSALKVILEAIRSFALPWII